MFINRQLPAWLLRVFVAIGDGGVLRFLLPYSVDEHIRRFSLRLDACQFAILPTSSMLRVMFGPTEREKAYEDWRRNWKHWETRRAVDADAHGNFVNIPFVRSVEKVPYDRWLAHLL